MVGVRVWVMSYDFRNEHANRLQCVTHTIDSSQVFLCKKKNKKISIDQFEFVFLLKTFELILKIKRWTRERESVCVTKVLYRVHLKNWTGKVAQILSHKRTTPHSNCFRVTCRCVYWLRLQAQAQQLERWHRGYKQRRWI